SIPAKEDSVREQHILGRLEHETKTMKHWIVQQRPSWKIAVQDTPHPLIGIKGQSGADARIRLYGKDKPDELLAEWPMRLFEDYLQFIPPSGIHEWYRIASRGKLGQVQISRITRYTLPCQCTPEFLEWLAEYMQLQFDEDTSPFGHERQLELQWERMGHAWYTQGGSKSFKETCDKLKYNSTELLQSIEKILTTNAHELSRLLTLDPRDVHVPLLSEDACTRLISNDGTLWLNVEFTGIWPITHLEYQLNPRQAEILGVTRADLRTPPDHDLTYFTLFFGPMTGKPTCVYQTEAEYLEFRDNCNIPFSTSGIDHEVLALSHLRNWILNRIVRDYRPTFQEAMDLCRPMELAFLYHKSEVKQQWLATHSRQSAHSPELKTLLEREYSSTSLERFFNLFTRKSWAWSTV